MARTEISQSRTRTTLLEQLSVMEPLSLSDLLKAGDEGNPSASGGRRTGAVTLASILESEKRGGRTLMDIIREEDARAESSRGGEGEEGPPMRMSLMMLLALTEGVDGTVVTVAEKEEEEENEKLVTMAVADERIVCCVCMVRRKGAAFIPCGHTFCRACSREVWIGRGSCPLCNGLIVDILDIF